VHIEQHKILVCVDCGFATFQVFGNTNATIQFADSAIFLDEVDGDEFTFAFGNEV
jgi:hypothetical protein